MQEDRVAFVASGSPVAQAAVANLKDHYGTTTQDEADVIVALGGDGFMLQCMHRYMDCGVPFYGMNRGSVGFLMNAYAVDGLPERVKDANKIVLRPLQMKGYLENGETVEALAINEIALTRDTHLAAKTRISVDGKVRLEELIADSILVATPAGSTAYNLSAHGPIISIEANILAMTPISAFRPRRWRGAMLSRGAEVLFEVLEQEKRPILATADFKELRRVLRVEVRESRDHELNLLYDPEHNLEERIISEQFLA